MVDEELHDPRSRHDLSAAEQAEADRQDLAKKIRQAEVWRHEVKLAQAAGRASKGR
jgi:hypothetical protein